MANTTNFGWETPDDTDLVKDGAAAMRTLGNAIDASLVDLKGGTTGQVLSKNTNTDMDFTWVTTDDANAIQNAIVDAKGDLIAASAADTPARLAVGANGDTLVADSSATTGLRWQPSQAAGRNYVINGSHEIWQRGTSFALSGGIAAYCSDRWQGYSTNLGRTVTRQGAATTGYYARVARDSGNSLTGLIYYGTSLESETTVNLIGKTVTMSFSARAGANFSAASGILSAYIVYGTGTNQNLFSGLTGQTTVATSNVTLTTSFQRFSVTGTVNAAATQMAVYFVYTPVGTAGAADYFELDDVQLELGSVATTFTPAAGTLAGEVAAAQRYCYVYSSGSLPAEIRSSTSGFAFMKLPVTMRTSPVATYAAAGSYSTNSAAKSGTLTSISTDTASPDFLSIALGFTGYTAGQAGTFFTSGSTTISAEL